MRPQRDSPKDSPVNGTSASVGRLNLASFIGAGHWPLNPSSTPDEIIDSSSKPAEDQMPVSLVATRFHLVEGMCKLKTRTHMGKLAAHFCEGTQRPGFQKADQTAGKRCRNGCVNCKSRASRLWINHVLDRTMRSRVRSTRKKQEVFKWKQCMEEFVHGKLAGCG